MDTDPPQHPCVAFRFALGQQVHWRGVPAQHQPYTVERRRYSESAVSTWIEYLLVAPEMSTASWWAYEPDLEEVE